MNIYLRAKEFCLSWLHILYLSGSLFAITFFVQFIIYILGGMCECSLSASLKTSCPLYENLVLKEWWQEKLILDEKFQTLGEEICLSACHVEIRRSRGTAPLISNFGTGWRWVVTFTTWLIYPREITLLVTTEWEPEGPQSWCGRFGDKMRGFR